MKEPKCSTHGNCPSCSGSEWKLAKMLVLAGLTQVDTNSKGGGFGVSMASGQGLGVNYQGLELSTSGTHIAAMAAEYSPPAIPEEYAKKEYWIKECNTNLEESVQTIVKADRFALNSDKIKPGILDGFSPDTSLSVYKNNFDKAHNHLLKFQEYEQKKAVWDETRVCNRCGESFIPSEGTKEVELSFKLPEYSFKGIDRHCPCCKSYQWKAAELYYYIPIRDLENQLKSEQNSLEKSIEYYNQPPKKGLLAWFDKPFFESIVPDKIKSDIIKTEAQLAKANDKRNKVLEKNGSFVNLRVCLKCESTYS